MIAVADTWGLLAVFNRSDPEHAATALAAGSCGLLVVSPLAITEIHQVATIRAGRSVADDIVGVITDRIASGRIAVAGMTAKHLGAALQVRRRYADLDLDLADAAAVVAAAEYRTDTVLTLDRRDFRAMRPLVGGEYFRLLPDDA